MPQRTFFELRYAVPGYTLILVVILIVFPKLQDLFLAGSNSDLFPIFLGFLTLLSGIPIGFLVSQVWYIIFRSQGYSKKYWWIKRCILGFGRSIQRDKREKIRDKYHLTKDKEQQILFTNFIENYLETTPKEFITYMQRRFDLMHTFGSTIIATIIGVLVGFTLTLDLNQTITLEEIIGFPDMIFKLSYNLPTEISLHGLAVSLVCIAIMISMFFSLRSTYSEHALATELVVNMLFESRKFGSEVAKINFPSEYFEKANTDT